MKLSKKSRYAAFRALIDLSVNSKSDQVSLKQHRGAQQYFSTVFGACVCRTPAGWHREEHKRTLRVVTC